MKNYPKPSSYLASSSKKNFKLGLLIAIGMCIVAFKLPLKQKNYAIHITTTEIESADIMESTTLPQRKHIPVNQKRIPPPTTTPPIIKFVDEVLENNASNKFEDVDTKELTLAPENRIEETTPVIPKPKKPYTTASIMPSFVGGAKAKRNYFSEAMPALNSRYINMEEGTVYVRFTVTKEGDIIDAEIVNSTNSLLNNAALQLVKNMPKWNPGQQNGTIVDVSLVLPINFVFR